MTTPEPKRALGYPRRFRLRDRRDILRVQRGGQRVRTPIGTVCLRRSKLGHARFGFAVSRKVGNAVVRNRVKRRLREVFRHLVGRAGSVDVMVLANPSASEASLERLRDAVEPAVLNPPPPRSSRGRGRDGQGRRRRGGRGRSKA